MGLGFSQFSGHATLGQEAGSLPIHLKLEILETSRALNEVRVGRYAT